MPKRINRIRGILKLIFATCSRNNAIHEISSAESKCIIFCRAERPTAGTEPPRRPYATFSAQSWHDGLKMTKDRNAVENRRFNRLKWLEKHERSAVDAHKRTITPRFAKFSQVAYYNETPFSPPTPMFRDFQAISASSVRSFARQRKQEVEMPRVVGGRDPRICTQRDIAEGGRSPRRRTAVPKIAFCKPDKGKQGTARHEQASCKRV